MTNLQKAGSLLIALHHEMEAGHGDDNKADAIRDEFDAPFYALSEGGRKQINDLSGNLYLLSTIDSYIPKPCHVDWPHIQPEDFSSLLENDSVEQALDFLQQIPIGPVWIKVALAECFSKCYAKLGFEAAALEFSNYVKSKK